MTNRIAKFDYARAIAIICVVLSHTALAYTFNPRDIFIDTFIHNLSGIGVPIFLFAAGYFLRVKSGQTFAAFMRDKIIRIYIPSIFWTIIFGVVFSFIGNHTDINPAELLGHIIFLTDPAFYYFTFAIMFLFIAGYFIAQVSDTRLLTIVRAAFVLNLATIVIYELAIWATPKGGSLPGDLMYRNPLAWVFFFIYGLYVARTNRDLSKGWFLRLSQNHALFIGLTLLLWLITSLETWVLIDRLLPGAQDYFKVASFFFEILAIHLIFIALNDFHPTGIVDKALTSIGLYSFFIYLTHMPTASKILGPERLLAWSNIHYIAMFIMALLCIGVPLLVAYVVNFVGSFVPLVSTLAVYIGLPKTQKPAPKTISDQPVKSQV